MKTDRWGGGGGTEVSACIECKSTAAARVPVRPPHLPQSDSFAVDGGRGEPPGLETCAEEFPRMNSLLVLSVMTFSTRAYADVAALIEFIGDKVNQMHFSGTRWSRGASKRQ